MTKTPLEAVRLFNGALDDASDSPAGVVLRGALALDTLHLLQTDSYQREVQPMSSQSRILDALTKGERLPDVVLGMRGHNFHMREGAFSLKDTTYIVDGLQRISTIIQYKHQNPTAEVHIGATVHMDTTPEWESDKFHKLNNWRNKLSPNILLRNMHKTNDGVRMLYGLSLNDRAFPLHHRVSWQQRMTKGELITALNFAKTVGYLHGHKVAASRSQVDDVAVGLQKLVDAVGVQVAKDNVRTFFDLVDTLWGIKSVQYKEGAIYMRGTFLGVLARLLSNHEDFWQNDDKRLFINVDLKRKLSQFKIYDPEVVRLAGSSGQAQTVLYIMMRDHLDKGKRSGRLTARAGVTIGGEEDDADDNNAE